MVFKIPKLNCISNLYECDFSSFSTRKSLAQVVFKERSFPQKKALNKMPPPSPAFTYRSISVQIFVIGNHRGQHWEYKGVEVRPSEST